MARSCAAETPCVEETVDDWVARAGVCPSMVDTGLLTGVVKLVSVIIVIKVDKASRGFDTDSDWDAWCRWGLLKWLAAFPKV